MTVEEFMRYELPTADTLRQRLAQDLFLGEKDEVALCFPFNYCEEKNGKDEIKPIFYRGIDLLKQLSETLVVLSTLYGPKAKSLAADFLELSRKADTYWDRRGDLSWKEITETIFDKSDEFARECFINGEAKPETPAPYAVLADTLAAAEAARDAAAANGATLAEVKATGDETRGLVGEIRTAQMTKKDRQSLAGKGGAAKGAGATSPKIIKARDEAARDLQEACRKVRGHLDKGSSLDVACREVCDQFRELPGSKKGGKTWEPLLSARLDAKGSRIRMEPTALMRRYREWCKENGLPSPREQAKQAKTRKRGQ